MAKVGVTTDLHVGQILEVEFDTETTISFHFYSDISSEIEHSEGLIPQAKKVVGELSNYCIFPSLIKIPRPIR